MINVLIPACGTSDYFADSYWPQNTIEIEGKPMIKYAIDSFTDVQDKRFIFALLQSECDKFHTDDIVRILTDGNCEILKLNQMSAGALCTALLSVQYIDNMEELILFNNDQYMECNIEEVLNEFRRQDADAGVICYEGTNPRWNYVRTENGLVLEAAEKHPISKNAIAGFYYIREGRSYVEAAKRAILKDRNHDGKFYHVAAINEMILEGKKIMIYTIPKEKYHSFYSPKQIELYERKHER